ncbi:hypothetical protein LRB11_15655, partial [Ectothiorhodospira haloalkaliphila]|nr:hypothetical protein [Ectothiorhodospira haloalkaliphila]
DITGRAFLIIKNIDLPRQIQLYIWLAAYQNPETLVLDYSYDGSGSFIGFVEKNLKEFIGEDFDVFESKACSALKAKSLHEYLSKSSKFFSDHYGKYSKSGRRAPIYWPLATASGSYILWLYYPDLTDQTLLTAINDFVDPKLKQVESELGNLRLTGTSRSKPNHDDGVQISAAPLWPLFRHRPWQNVLRETWEKLEQGDYDWAHLAMAYWPERVREKCVTDKSLAIAHDLEHIYVEPEPAPKKTRGRKKNTREQ